MNFIKKITLENWQSHVNTTIEPALPGQLTVITGPSDSGKTVILRALRWVFNNQPQGNDFIRVGASFARVTVEFASGDAVVRWRSTGSINRYVVNGETYEGFGSSVPLEVMELTGVRPVKIGDLEFNLNLAEQLDGPFLGKSISAGARAKVLGKLAGTEKIDYAAKQLGTDLYRRNQDEKRLAGEAAVLKERIKEFDYLPAMAQKIEKLSTMVEQIKLGQSARNKLAELKERLAETDGKIAGAQAALWRWRNLGEAEKILAEAAESRQSRETLVALTDRYWTYQKNIWACRKVIAKYAGLPEAETFYSRAEKALARMKGLEQAKTRFHGAENGLGEAGKVLSRLQGVEKAGEIAGKIAELLVKRDILIRLRNGYNGTTSRVDQEQKALAKLAGVNEAEAVLKTAGEKRRRWEKLVILQDKFVSLCGLIEDVRAKAVIWENRVAELQGAYQDELDSFGMCPVCGALKNEMRIKEVV